MKQLNFSEDELQVFKDLATLINDKMGLKLSVKEMLVFIAKTTIKENTPSIRVL